MSPAHCLRFCPAKSPEPIRPAGMLSWILRDKVITGLLTGTSRPSHILDNIRAIDNKKFFEKELKKIDEICDMSE